MYVSDKYKRVLLHLHTKYLVVLMTYEKLGSEVKGRHGSTWPMQL